MAEVLSRRATTRAPRGTRVHCRRNPHVQMCRAACDSDPLGPIRSTQPTTSRCCSLVRPLTSGLGCQCRHLVHGRLDVSYHDVRAGALSWVGRPGSVARDLRVAPPRFLPDGASLAYSSSGDSRFEYVAGHRADEPPRSPPVVYDLGDVAMGQRFSRTGGLEPKRRRLPLSPEYPARSAALQVEVFGTRADRTARPTRRMANTDCERPAVHHHPRDHRLGLLLARAPSERGSDQPPTESRDDDRSRRQASTCRGHW